MGTTCGPKPYNVKDYLMRQYTFENDHYASRAIDCKIVKLHTAYLAVEHRTKATGERRVLAAVVILSYTRGDYPFCEKHIDETMGPYHCECPDSILRLLTPTDNENALAWRNACMDNIYNPITPYHVYAEFGEVKKYQKLGAAVKYARKLTGVVGDKVFLRIKRTGGEDSLYGVSYFGGSFWHVDGPRTLRFGREVV